MPANSEPEANDDDDEISINISDQLEATSDISINEGEVVRAKKPEASGRQQQQQQQQQHHHRQRRRAKTDRGSDKSAPTTASELQGDHCGPTTARSRSHHKLEGRSQRQSHQRTAQGAQDDTQWSSAAIGELPAACYLPHHHSEACRLLVAELDEGNNKQVAVESGRPEVRPTLPTICGQLLGLVCALLCVLYLVDFVQRTMTNLFSKLLGGSGERRRSLAGGSSGSSRPTTPIGSQQQQHQHHHQMENNGSQSLLAQSQSSSTLNLPVTSYSQQQRRSSRTSIHSLFSALTGSHSQSHSQSQSQSQQPTASASYSSNNSNTIGRSIIKNKEDTVIIAASSPTIIQKESTDSGTVLGSGGAHCAIGGSGSGVGAAHAGPIGLGVADSSAAEAAAAVELALTDQSLHEAVRAGGVSPALLAAAVNAGAAQALAVAAQAAIDPQHQASSAAVSGGGGQRIGPMHQLPAVATQLLTSGLHQAPEVSGPQHAPLNASNTMKQAQAPTNTNTNTNNNSPRKSGPANVQGSASQLAARRAEVLRATELLLNALNQGDYDTYTRLCDPHMTSFEPELCGQLVDNMELRRLNLDQARQIQLHGQLAAASHSHLAQQVAGAAAAAAAQAAAHVLLAPQAGPTSATPTKQQAGQQQQQIQAAQQIAAAAAQAATQAAFTHLTLGAGGGMTANMVTTPTSSTLVAANQCNSGESLIRRYSLMINPNVYMLGDDAASIAYTNLSHTIALETGAVSVQQSEETRVWHRRDGKRWLCVHLHLSRATSSSSSNAHNHHNNNNSHREGPQTNASLIRSMTNRQQLVSIGLSHHQTSSSSSSATAAAATTTTTTNQTTTTQQNNAPNL